MEIKSYNSNSLPESCSMNCKYAAPGERSSYGTCIPGTAIFCILLQIYNSRGNKCKAKQEEKVIHSHDVKK